MDFYSIGLDGANGLSRTYEENRCYILVMRGYLKRKVTSSEATINWHAIEAGATETFMVCVHYMRMLR